MNMPKFTPGPWSLLFNDKTKVVLEQQGVAVFVADTYAGFTKSEEEQKANAALIAAAPEMYRDLHEAVVEMCSNCPSGKNSGGEMCESTADCFVAKWKITLEKARGEC